ncbi:MAG TPA: peptidylprolyl isomerase [Anaerolineales bacterium]|nr:peptidylprolyl isomerase [Anaerolineales bacterium]
MSNQGSNPKTITKKHLARAERERRQTRLILGIGLGGIILVVALLGYGYLNLNFFQQREPIAEVNGEAITTGYWQERIQVERINLLNQFNYLQFQQNFGIDTTQQQQQVLFTLQSPDILGQQVLDQLVDEELMRQEAERLDITVSDEEIEEAIQSTYEFFPDGTPTPTTTPTAISFPTLSSEQLTLYPSTAIPTNAFTSTPAPTSTPDPSITSTPTSAPAPATPTFVPEAASATGTPYTLEGFNQRYADEVENFKASGISESTLRKLFEIDLLRRKLRDALTADVAPTEEQVWARHILINDERSLGIVRSLLAAGWDFAEVAKKYSQDTGSGINGGDLGWFGRGAMVAEFENAAFSQAIGEIGEPVQSQFGFHIIQVLGHEEIPISASQWEQKRDTAFTEWLVQAREEATIVINEDWPQRVPEIPENFGQQQP